MRRERLLALAIAAVLLGGLLAAATVDKADHEPVAALPTATPLATPSPTPTGTPTPTPSATAAPTPTPRKAPPSPTARRPDHVRTTSAAARSGPYAPLSGTYTLSPGAGSTQTPFTLTIDMRDGDGRAQVDQVIWGDGDRFRPNPGPAIACPMPSPTPAGQPYRPKTSSSTVRYGHAWRHPGTYVVRVQLISYPWPCTDSKAQSQHTEGRLSIHISAGEKTTQGPALPVIGPIEVTQGASIPSTYVSFPAYDTDGRIGSIAVDWGDGESTGRVMEDGCDDGSGAYYPGTQADSGRADHEMDHQYARHGRYRVVVSVYSEGCLGRDQQHTSRTVDVRY